MNGKVIWCAWGAVAAGVWVFLCYLFMAAFGGYFSGSILDLGKAAHIGTFVGGTVGALWALAGVFFFYAALKVQEESLDKLKDSIYQQERLLGLQKDELKLQREEMKTTREEYKLQREEMEMTRKIFERQSFESTFFSIVEQAKDLGRQISHKVNGNVLKIYVSFSIVANKLAADKNTSEMDYSESKQFIDIIQLGIDYIYDNDWGTLRIKGQDHAIVRGLKALFADENSKEIDDSNKINIDKFINEIKVWWAGTEDSTERDRMAYMSILSRVVPSKGRALFFYYVFTCNSAYKQKALELGFFDGLAISELLSESDYAMCSDLKIVDALMYYRPSVSES